MKPIAPTFRGPMHRNGVKSVRRIGAVLGCLLTLMSRPNAFGGAASQVSEPAVIWLGIGQRPKTSTPTGLLAWEIYRQAFLIAARDGLGLGTRDESLREWGTPPATILAPTMEGRDLRFSVQGSSPEEIIWSGKIEGDDWPNNDAGIAAVAEMLSREEFVAALQKQGFEGQGDLFRPGAAEPAGAESLLGQMDEYSQFAAVRLTHAAIRSDGESLARLGVLVRAYANLGQLTRYHWSIESKVYAARSLLYAQRMIARDPGSTQALWHRAYARALAGLQRSALEDLSAVGKFSDNQPPAWAYLLDAYCRYQTSRLTDLATKTPSQKSLALYLAFLTLENSKSQGAMMNAGLAALEANATCLQLIDTMCDQTGPGMLGELIGQGSQIFDRMLSDRLERMPGMPASVVKLVGGSNLSDGNPTNRAKICQALIDAGTPTQDRGEPSLTALGRMVQETTFAQVRRNANFLCSHLGVDATDYVREAWPLVSDHPFKNTIKAHGLWHAGDLKAIDKALAGQLLSRVRYSQFAALYVLDKGFRQGGKGYVDMAWLELWHNLDCTSFDVEPLVNWVWDDVYDKVPWMIQFLDFSSPDSPVLIATQIREKWNDAQAKNWESEHGDQPGVAIALGQHYLQAKKGDEAERWLKKYIAISPDQWGYELLAGIYRDQHKPDQWLATLKEYLNQPDYGLQHMSVQVEIARYYMDRGDYSAALPFADEAAETGAAEGESCDSEAHTGVGDWPTAERLIIGEIGRYGESPYAWFAWCVRTGHGDRNGATAALQKYLSDPARARSEEGRMQLATMLMLEQNDAEAIKTFPIKAKGHRAVVSFLHVAILDDAAGDSGGRDQAIQDAIDASHDGSSLNGFGHLLAETFSSGPDAMPDAEWIDKLLKTAKTDDRISICYLTARCFENRGKTDQANEYLRRGISGHSTNSLDLLLIADALRKRGIDPAALELATTRHGDTGAGTEPSKNP